MITFNPRPTLQSEVLFQSLLLHVLHVMLLYKRMELTAVFKEMAP